MPRQKKIRLKKRKDGRYACRYKNLWFYGETSEEALAAREYYKTHEGDSESGQISIIEYADEWLSLYRPNIKPHTHNTYAAALDRFFKPVKTQQVRTIGTSEIALCIQGINNFSGYHINRTMFLVRAILDTAVEERLLPTNPARSKSLSIPQGKNGKGHRAIEDWERKLIHETMHPLRAMYLVMLYAGLRPGEALGINITDDVNFEKGIIHVRRSIDLHTEKNGVESAGKNQFAIRDVPLIPLLAQELKGLSGLLVPGKKGYIGKDAYRMLTLSYRTALLHKANGIEGHHAPKVKPKGWKEITFTAYDMRHSYCTMCRDAGIDQKVLMQWMGHTDYTMIMRVYDHITPERLETSSENLSLITSQKYGNSAES